MKPHPQAKWIKAKADGHAIQYQACKDPVDWGDMHDENWSFPEDMVFRIKPTAPEVEYPVTRMDAKDFCELGKDVGMCSSIVARKIANAAIRHAIDSQQVIRMAEVQEIASQLGKDKRAARDMAVAEAVKSSLKIVSVEHGIEMGFPDLATVIASVK